MQNSIQTFKPLEYTGYSLKLLDQRALPNDEIYVECKTTTEIIDAIKLMIVRGAPAIGCAGAWACCIAAKETKNTEELLQKFQEIENARPTAVNLAKAVQRQRQVLQNKGINFLEEEAQAIFAEDELMCSQMAAYGLTVLPNKTEYNIVTHCNTGSLATAGLGTALGIIKLLAQQNRKVTVYASETRPYLQGARLTAWELQKCGIDVVVMPDSAGAYLMKSKKIDAVFVGADRIVANGDTANKIGTYSHALAAKAHNVPFYVVAPNTSIDLSLATGEEIEIEQRLADELIVFNGIRIAPAQVQTFNPGFDVTPGNLITAFITEKGVFTPDKLKLSH
jgi:methylthioribose-1-phosphate isomerase